jgi:type IV fimbrial biogenesis protein FimT
MLSKKLGFTLLELLITLLVFSIVVMTAAPSMQKLVESRKVSSTTTVLISYMSLARQEAIRSNLSVLIDSPDAATVSKDWASGFRITSDTNRDGEYEDDETILIGTPSTNRLSLNASLDTTGFRFLASGLINVSNGVTFDICPERKNATGTKVSVLYSGQIMKEDIACV